MSAFSKVALTFGLVAAFAGTVSAQGRGPGGGFNRGGVVGLITNESVQKELKLEEDQIEKAKGVADELREKSRESMSSLQDLEPAERMKKFQEINWTTNEEGLKALGAFMKPEQTKRLKEIVLQQQGANALTYPPFAKKLNVTDDQSDKVRTIITDSFTEMREAMQAEGSDRMAAMEKIRKETNEKVLAVMTDDQKKQYKEMLGEPFEVKMEGRPGGRPRGRGNN
ncbi:hypothetical protein TA3x_005329 [Tundrisphaera sp. TA3]|uniref:hypothetical protein n=1 Tax=Tundrisphaera sp. TA3 TaxID=3435775 RepID=UPI003EBE2131